MIELTIDGKVIKTKPGTTILQAALGNGMYIPNLCYDKTAQALRRMQAMRSGSGRTEKTLCRLLFTRRGRHGCHDRNTEACKGPENCA